MLTFPYGMNALDDHHPSRYTSSELIPIGDSLVAPPFSPNAVQTPSGPLATSRPSLLSPTSQPLPSIPRSSTSSTLLSRSPFILTSTLSFHPWSPLKPSDLTSTIFTSGAAPSLHLPLAHLGGNKHCYPIPYSCLSKFSNYLYTEYCTDIRSRT